MNFHISYPGQLCNQLVLLHYIYNTFEQVDKIYAPRFDQYRPYFNIDNRDVLCNQDFFINNQDSFLHIDWGTQKYATVPELYHPKFNDFKLKKHYEEKVKEIANSFGNIPLVSVHIRQGDFKEFSGGECFFSIDRYVEVVTQKVKDWKLTEYLTLFFSDIILPPLSGGKIVSELTGNIGPIDLFLMAQCSYFIHTWSTFSLIAIQLSKSLGKYKNNHLMDKG
jgi:hypothetical protein